MTHISKHPLTSEVRKDIEERILLFLINTKIGNRKMIFRELLTKTERVMIAKRLSLIFLLSKQAPPYAISRTLKISPSTVARFQIALDRGLYQETLKWLNPRQSSDSFLKLLSELASIPFEAKRKSITQLVREIDEKYSR